MNKILLVCCLLIGLSCKPSQFVFIEPQMCGNAAPSTSNKYIFFVHSNTQINGRITMDQLVRLSSHASKQGYLYTQGNRITQSNWNDYQKKLLNEQYQYALLMYIRPSNQAAINAQGASFIQDYLLFIDPCLYNPTCQFTAEKYVIESKLYVIKQDSCIWQSTSKTFTETDVHQSFVKHAEAVVKQLKKQGYMHK